MITFITGTPGSGKTAYLLNMMINEVPDYLERPLFAHGIPEFKLDHEILYCSAKMCKCCGELGRDEPGFDRSAVLFAENWHEFAPDGAIILMDEVQNVYRPRRGGEIPESMMAFETHRHSGIDFYLISQAPRLTDANLKSFVSRHIHLKATWARRIQLEWPECQDNTKSVGEAIKSNYSLNKKVFPLYKSASLHTTQNRKKPPAVYALVVLVFVLVGIFLSLGDRFGITALAGESIDVDSVALMSSVDAERSTDVDHLLVAVDAPRMSACVSNDSTGACICYTQQMTRYEATYKECVDYIAGRTFDPYQPPKIPSKNSKS